MTLIPKAALESHIGILGKTGSGKSNLAKVIAEQLMAAHERVCAIDPTGTWWGLRLSADGKKPSPFAPVIFGGDHGDLALGEHHGAVLAEAIGTSAGSAIIDTQQMKVGERTRFVASFAETILRANRGPLHLILDEAHLFAPQGKVNDPQSGMMLHAVNNLVSLGRGRGLRIILISQRPAKLHKDSLSQIETLIAMRLVAPQDRAAVQDWVGEWADIAKGKEIISSLPSLPVGDGWVWSPQLDFLERRHFPIAATFDSGTAEANAKARELPPIDTAALGDKMDTIRQEAQANDPRRLRAKIAELETTIRKTTSNVVEKVIDQEAVDRAFAEGRAAGYDQGVAQGQAIAYSHAGEQLGTMATALEELAQKRRDQTAEFTRKIDGRVSTIAPKVQTPGKAPAVVANGGKPAPIVAKPLVAINGFTGPQMKVLGALSLWRSLGKDQPTKAMVAMCAGYSHSSGGFGNLLSSLKTAGAIEYPSAGQIRLLAQVDGIGSAEAKKMLLGKLTNPQRKIFDALADGEEMSKTELGEATGYSPTSGGFGNLLSSLRTLGLIDYPGAGRITIEPWVMEIL